MKESVKFGEGFGKCWRKPSDGVYDGAIRRADSRIQSFRLLTYATR